MENKEYEVPYEVPTEVEEMAEELSGGYFNYRLVETVYNYGENIQENYYEIYEIYYKANGDIWAWSSEPVNLVFADFEDAMETIKHVTECCEKTVLRFKDEKKEELYDTGKKIDGYKPLLKK